MMPASTGEATIVFALGIFLVLVLKVIQKLSSIYLTPIRHLRGPPRGSLFRGNLINIGRHKEQYQKWVEEYGHVFIMRSLFQMPMLFTTDVRALNHVLTHSTDYPKPEASHRRLSRVLGNGVLVAEGETHRHQRRVMNPAFGPAQIRELTDIFLDKAKALCEFWDKQITSNGGRGRINVMDGLSKMTLDVIGLAGFNYYFDALNTDRPPNELNEAFSQLTQHPPQGELLFMLRGMIPGFQHLPTATRKRVTKARAVMERVAKQIMDEKKSEILREYSEKGSNGHVEKKNMQSRDLLTLLMKANLASDIPENQRMTDDEVLAQIPTFLGAGHETTSTATTWCLYALSKFPAIQEKLRNELLTVDTDMPSMEELQALPYLDQVVHETLRLHAPVSGVPRVATKDDVLPVSAPFLDKDGKEHHEIRISKGTGVIIPIIVLHTSRELWGDDAFEFKPERWENPPDKIASMPGVWGHLMTFLGGPRACIGYRFSLVEMKALIFTLVRAFEFELAVPVQDIKVMGPGAIVRPLVSSEAEKGAQLPLILRPYKRV